MKRLYLGHNSCLNSSYDFNILKAGLQKEGYEVTQDPAEADEIIFSGCSAHETWVSDAIRIINDMATDPDKKITVTGCLASVDMDRVQSQIVSNHLEFRSYRDIMSSYTALDFDAIDQEHSQGQGAEFEDHTVDSLRLRVGPEKLAVVFELDRIDREYGSRVLPYYKNTTKGFIFYYESEPVEFITVSRSCLYKCSFCSIPQGRGDYTSLPIEHILAKAQAAVAKGVRRITLVGDEVGNYGTDQKGAGVAELVSRMLALDADLKLGIRYIEPTPFLKNYDLFEEYCRQGRIYILYAPLQTGSQRILRAMNRRYDLADVAEKYKRLISSTDTVFFCNWMVGFPSESESDFEQTLQLAEYIDFHTSSAIPYSERPNTKAPMLPGKVQSEVVMDRLLRLRDVLADLKVRRIRKQLDFLDEHRRGEILELVRRAELVHIEPELNRPTVPAGDSAMVQLGR